MATSKQMKEGEWTKKESKPWLLSFSKLVGILARLHLCRLRRNHPKQTNTSCIVCAMHIAFADYVEMNWKTLRGVLRARTMKKQPTIPCHNHRRLTSVDLRGGRLCLVILRTLPRLHYRNLRYHPQSQIKRAAKCRRLALLLDYRYAICWRSPLVRFGNQNECCFADAHHQLVAMNWFGYQPKKTKWNMRYQFIHHIDAGLIFNISRLVGIPIIIINMQEGIVGGRETVRRCCPSQYNHQHQKILQTTTAVVCRRKDSCIGLAYQWKDKCLVHLSSHSHTTHNYLQTSMLHVILSI